MKEVVGLLKEAKEAGFNIEARVAKINEGFSFHEKAIFCINAGVLKVYSIEPLKTKQKEAIAGCNTTKELEETIKKMDIRTGQPIYIMDGVYFDDFYLFDIKDGSVELYMISPAAKKLD